MTTKYSSSLLWQIFYVILTVIVITGFLQYLNYMYECSVSYEQPRKWVPTDPNFSHYFASAEYLEPYKRTNVAIILQGVTVRCAYYFSFLIRILLFTELLNYISLLVTLFLS
jgi:hypothetical protein